MESSSDESFWNHCHTPIRRASPEAEQRPFQLWERERLERTIECLRLAKAEEVKQVAIKARNDTKREIQEHLRAMEAQFKEYALELNDKFKDLTHVVSTKDREIAHLRKFIQEQQSLMLEFAIKERTPPPVPEPQPNTAKLQKELDAAYIQLDALKDLCVAARNDADRADARSKELLAEIQRLTAHHEQAIVNTRQENAELIETLRKECIKLNHEFSTYKVFTEAECLSRDAIQSRQHEFINSLQGELRNAKKVLTSPKAHSRLHEKLSDYTRKSSSKPRHKLRRRLTNLTVPDDCAVKSVLNMRRGSVGAAEERPVFHISYRSPRDFSKRLGL